MELIQVILTSLLSISVLFLLTKLNGNKQISELTMFDYIVSITIGSISAELATELEKPLRPLVAMTVYAAVSALISFITAKSLKIRRFLFGHTIVLMENGNLYRKNLKKARIDLSEFLMQARTNGYFDIAGIDTAVLEPSGKISFLPFSANRPATPEDLKIVPKAEGVFLNVIMDGVILEKNLKTAGRDVNWLNNELKSQGVKRADGVFLATLDRNGTLNVFENREEKIVNDYFE